MDKSHSLASYFGLDAFCLAVLGTARPHIPLTHSFSALILVACLSVRVLLARTKNTSAHTNHQLGHSSVRRLPRKARMEQSATLQQSEAQLKRADCHPVCPDSPDSPDSQCLVNFRRVKKEKKKRKKLFLFCPPNHLPDRQ